MRPATTLKVMPQHRAVIFNLAERMTALVATMERVRP